MRVIAALAAVAMVLGAVSAAEPPSSGEFDPVVPGRKLAMPRDAGAHPGHRIEWWYLTGQLDTARGPLGFQVTFFRLRNREAESNPSRFSPRQLLFAHAALADPARGSLVREQRSARMLADLVAADTGDTDVRIDNWSLRRETGTYRARIEGKDFAFDLALAPTQPMLPEGDAGFSRKGPAPAQASYYYSEPQLKVSGRVRDGAEWREVRGLAWLDHEWSSEPLAEAALGWDWIGLNLDDGGALMAFRIRGRDGERVWAGATLRVAAGQPASFGPASVHFTVRRTWKSPRTGTAYPVAIDLEVEGKTWRIDPLMDDQELDARASTGTLYWEGAVRAEGGDGLRGRGYLELTGYAERLRF
jgi:predicted secreted hydrolase